MKPESIKSVLRWYLKERQNSSSYNVLPNYLHEPPEYRPDFLGSAYEPSTPILKDFHGYIPSKYMLKAQGLNCVENGADDWKPEGANLPFEELHDWEPQSANLPLDELNVPLEPDLELLAREVGHRLNQMTDEFDANRIYASSNLATSNGNRMIRFKECIICVPLSSDRVQIPVILSKAANEVVNATWRTCDKSAEAGIHYVSRQGSISFAQNDEEKTIEVEIIRSQERKSDIHFAVELLDADGTFNAIMVYIVDDSRSYLEDEQQCIQNIFNCAHNISISEILTCLRDMVTPNTFKAALQCLCSSADSIPRELALASELLRLTMHHAPLSTLTNVFCEFFSYLPELEDVAPMF